MKLAQSKFFFVVTLLLLTAPSIALGQTTKPKLRRSTAKKVVLLVPVGTNLKVRLNDTLSSKDSRAGDKFTAYVLDPVRFNEATVRGYVRSINKSGRIKGRTTMNLAFDSISLADGRTGTLHGY